MKKKKGAGPAPVENQVLVKGRAIFMVHPRSGDLVPVLNMCQECGQKHCSLHRDICANYLCRAKLTKPKPVAAGVLGSKPAPKAKVVHPRQPAPVQAASEVVSEEMAPAAVIAAVVPRVLLSKHNLKLCKQAGLPMALARQTLAGLGTEAQVVQSATQGQREAEIARLERQLVYFEGDPGTFSEAQVLELKAKIAELGAVAGPSPEQMETFQAKLMQVKAQHKTNIKMAAKAFADKDADIRARIKLLHEEHSEAHRAHLALRATNNTFLKELEVATSHQRVADEGQAVVTDQAIAAILPTAQDMQKIMLHLGAGLHDDAKYKGNTDLVNAILADLTAATAHAHGMAEAAKDHAEDVFPPEWQDLPAIPKGELDEHDEEDMED